MARDCLVALSASDGSTLKFAQTWGYKDGNNATYALTTSPISSSYLTRRFRWSIPISLFIASTRARLSSASVAVERLGGVDVEGEVDGEGTEGCSWCLAR